MSTNIAVFASGTGSDAKKIVNHFKHHPEINVCLIVSNNPEAKVLGMAAEEDIPKLLVTKNEFRDASYILRIFNEYSIDYVVLAGFLLLVPTYLVDAYDQRMVNIHPSLLPKYGGKGMYGINVHKAVKAAGENQSGITIHYVNKHYDEGDIVFQKSCPVSKTDTPEQIAEKVLRLEHKYFPLVVEELVNNLSPAS